MIIRFLAIIATLIITIFPARAGDFSGGVHDPIFEFTSVQVIDSTSDHLLFFKLDQITSLNILMQLNYVDDPDIDIRYYSGDVILSSTDGYFAYTSFNPIHPFAYFNYLPAGDYTYDLRFSEYLVGSYVSIHSSVYEVPEPQTYALMLVGLGALGFVTRRRKSL